jgi:hypothetical protein
MNPNERPMEIRGWRKTPQFIPVETAGFYKDQAM